MNEKKTHNSFVIQFGAGDDATILLNNIKFFAQTQNMSYKRFFLMAVASYVQETGQSPELIAQIAEHLAKPRKNARIV